MPDLEIANHAVKAAKASAVKRHIASAVWCLGWTYRQLGDVRALPSIQYVGHLHSAKTVLQFHIDGLLISRQCSKSLYPS